MPVREAYGHTESLQRNPIHPHRPEMSKEVAGVFEGTGETLPLSQASLATGERHARAIAELEKKKV